MELSYLGDETRMNAEQLKIFRTSLDAWLTEGEAEVSSSDGFSSRPIYPYVVVIDEPGMGYAEPCYSYEAALRAMKRLSDKGYRARIRRMK